MHVILLFNNLNIRFIKIWTNFEICMRTYRICYMLFPASFKLALMCCSCLHHLLPWVASCSLVLQHTCLCIMSCICVVCLLCCVLLFDSSSFVAIVRIRSSTLGSSSWLHLLHGLVLLPCGISKDDRYPGSQYYLCYASCFVLSLCCATDQLFIKPSHIAMNL